MALEMKMNLRMSQQLIMTPQLQQAIKLLQLNHLEMVEQIQQELVENPCLDEVAEPAESPQDLPDSGPELSLDTPDNGGAAIDWNTYLQNRSVSDYRGGGSYEDEEREQSETVLTRAADLATHLEWQLHMADLDQESRATGVILIGHIGDNGYLITPLAEICETESLEPDHAEWVLERIQTFDPTGVGARDLSECLMLQLRAMGYTNAIVLDMVERHLPDLQKQDFKTVAKALNCAVEDVVDGMRIIARLEPKPGRPFSAERPQYITPDIYVRKVGDDYVITLNDDGMPKLRVSNYYKKILQQKSSGNKTEQEYIQEKLRSAVWLIRSIHQRQRTIYKVTESIIKFQREFLEKGIKFLKPLILRDVAEDIGMHESTVSRVTTNKYVHTPQGIFELKYFFNSGIGSADGNAVASESVKDIITKIVADENPKKPLSDQKIMEILNDREGLSIKRRTVTKYREMLGILSSAKRKRLY
ncbi:MAG: RNA polymerase factor sigma-54 [Candidatus Lernaella stagnicola]|nr:RNA polymerase factor sigma-54 [Candidatus Lernaella stagnicola]